MKYVLTLLPLWLHYAAGFFDIQNIISGTVMTRLPRDFSVAIKDIADGLPTKTMTVVTGSSTNIRSEDMFKLLCVLSENHIPVINLDLLTQENKDKFFNYIKTALDTSEERTSLILCEPYECETILEELADNNLIHRMILYIFFWRNGAVSSKFLTTIKEAMKVAVITHPRKSVFRVYYNQATPDRPHHLSLVNWWSDGLYKSPVLPPTDRVYHDFKGRVFDVPVLHAPPWHFLENDTASNIPAVSEPTESPLNEAVNRTAVTTYANKSASNKSEASNMTERLVVKNKVKVTGGRDDKLLKLIANTLNFKFKYYDPPERSQGSSISGNGTFRGTLGLIWKREAEFFLGDVTITWERLQAVDFSFFTLADSGAFMTHAPAKLSETLAIIRPFRWEVWPLVCATLLVTGPALWFVIAAPSFWRRDGGKQLSLLNNCCWFTTTLFLRQSSSKEPSKTHKARLVSILISLGATYVIGDMYSANLTSLLARPAREKPIGTLQDLEEAMREGGYELLVERHSSSLTILQNGTGVYGRLARLMRRQKRQIVANVEEGVKLVLENKNHYALLGGRETLYYDTERFGSHHFHLSEKLYTRYSAIALQIGCPYLETFNKVVMTLFEAGILAKMTTDEYKNLPQHSRRSTPVTETDSEGGVGIGDSPPAVMSQAESTKGLEPVSLRMLRGAFLLLGIGHLFAAIVLATEIQLHRRMKRRENRVKDTDTKLAPKRHVKIKTKFARFARNVARAFGGFIDRALGPGNG